jgi:hypothetical protein
MATVRDRQTAVEHYAVGLLSDGHPKSAKNAGHPCNGS